MKLVVKQEIFYSDGTVATLTKANSNLKFYRVKHDKEIGKLWRGGDPEIHPLFDNHHSPFKKWAQQVSYEINKAYLSVRRWTDFYHFGHVFTNNQGFGMDNDPRANFVAGTNLTKELPRVEALISGGSLVIGERKGDWTTIKGLHFDTPVSVEYLRQHPEFWVRGVWVGGTGKIYRLLGDKYSGPAIIHPLIINKQKGELVIASYKLQEWKSNEPPDPLKLYL